MGSWDIRQSTPADAEQLLPVLRAADRAEIEAGSGEDTLTVLRISQSMSRFTWAATYGGCIQLLLGTADNPDGSGCPWMLGAEGVDRRPGALTKIALAHIGLVKQFYPRLRNYVHAENSRSVRWLGRIGFTIHEPEPFGVKGAPFHPFTMDY